MTLLHVFAALIVGGLLGYGTFAVAPDALGGYLPAIAAALGTGVTFLGLGRFGRKPSTPISVVPTTTNTARRTTGRDNLVAKDTPPAKEKPVRPQPVVSEPVRFDDGGLTQRIDFNGEEHLDIVAERQADGTTKITVTATGFTGSRYKTKIRPRYDAVKGIKGVVASEKNLGNRERKFEAVVPTDQRDRALGLLAKR